VSTQTDSPARGASSRQFPPVAELAVASLALAIIGGIFMASYFPRRPPLGLPIALVVASAVLVATAVVMLSRLREFAWDKFFLVGRWTLAAYVVQAGMIEYAFVHNHASGAPLVIVTLMLVMFAFNVPLIISFTVARYQSS